MHTGSGSAYDRGMASNSESTGGPRFERRRRLSLWWFALPAALLLILLLVSSIRKPTLPTSAGRFLGSWTYSSSSGAKDKLIHFRADGSAHWRSATGGSYLEWVADDDSLVIYEYPNKLDAYRNRITAPVYGPHPGNEFEIVSVSDDQFQLRRDYRDQQTGEMRSETIDFRRLQRAVIETAD